MSSAPVPDVIVPESAQILGTLNWLRAGVLGANDGIVSTAAIIFGVAGASATHATVMLAGIAAVAAVAVLIAMALTGFVSARLGRTPVWRSVARNVAGGLLALGITYGVGQIAGTQI